MIHSISWKMMLFSIACGLSLLMQPHFAWSDECTGRRPEPECDKGVEFTLDPPPGHAFMCEWKVSTCVSKNERSYIWMGDRGAGVREVQGLLEKYGNKVPTDGTFKVPASGTFDKDTEKAVRKFQEQKGLKVDGKVGGETLSRLRSTE